MNCPKVSRLLAVLAFGLTLAGCGKCGPEFWPFRVDSGEAPLSCRSDAPQPR
jgi:hypothetical protein